MRVIECSGATCFFVVRATVLTSRLYQLRGDSSRLAMPKPHSRPEPLLLEGDSLESLDGQSPDIPVGDGSMEPNQPDTADSDDSVDTPAGSGYVTPDRWGSYEASELYYAYYGHESQPEVPRLIQLALQELQQQQEALMAGEVASEEDGVEGDSDDGAQTPGRVCECCQHSKPRWADLSDNDDEGTGVEDIWPDMVAIPISSVSQMTSAAPSASGSASSAASSSTSSGTPIANVNVPGFRQGMEVHRGMWH